MNRIPEFLAYYSLSAKMGDIDPAHPVAVYICDRYELTQEQRIWMAFLYGATYCFPTAFYIYNEFPENFDVDIPRMERWWSGHKHQTVFQTDRQWIKSRNQFVDMFKSYSETCGNSQTETYQGMYSTNPYEFYDRAYRYFGKVYQMGRFTLFNYLDNVKHVAGFNLEPETIDWRTAQSSRNGLCFALGRDDLLRGHNYLSSPLLSGDYSFLETGFQALMQCLRAKFPKLHPDVFAAETVLCALKKYYRGKRYPGYYLDRQYSEICKMQELVTEGVDWSPLLEARREIFRSEHLIEDGARNSELASLRLSIELEEITA